MPEEYYPREQMDLKLNSIGDKIDSNHDKVMDELVQHRNDHTELLKQVRETNGRVRALEVWKAGLAGAVAVLSVLVIPTVSYLIKNAL